MEWYLKSWRKYADFSGRARRKEYWAFYFINRLIGLIPRIFIVSSRYTYGVYADSIYSDPSFIASIILLIFYLAILLPDLAVTVRRLHDINLSGWYALISLIPIVGWILIIVWMCTDSNLGENDYGPDPKAEEVYEYSNAESILIGK